MAISYADEGDVVSGMGFQVQVSADGTTWSDISGFSNSIKPDGGELQTAEAYVFQKDAPIITVGKTDPVELTLSILYTEGASEATAVIHGYYAAKTLVYLRYSPKGGTAGQWMWTGQGYFTKPIYPEGNSSKADSIMVETTFKTATLTKSTVAAS